MDSLEELETEASVSEEIGYRYVIGIDLGTTNSAVAYVDLYVDLQEGTSEEHQDSGSLASENGNSPVTKRQIRYLQIPQLVAAGEVGIRSVLPSFLYLPGDYDLPEGSTDLPWAAERIFAVGEFAREQGAHVPERLVASAKSWLSYSAVDRTAPILPWGSDDDVAKVSPVEASVRYLQHIREAWNEQMAGQDDGAESDQQSQFQPLQADEGDGAALGEMSWSDPNIFDEQLVILTVPASFDEVARELTLTAAREAGMKGVVLLEEPQAAFYAWLSRHEEDWQKRMSAGELILVCDVGGGTSDFTVIAVREGVTGLRFDRLAVGEHLMLGGDNMDLALGRFAETRMLGQPGKLDPGRWPQLVYQSRKAKEILLDRSTKEEQVELSIVGQGSSLIGGTLRASLDRTDIEQVILDGFFPQTSLDAPASRSARSGLMELGLPYVQDPAITRHLAQFWQRFQPLLQSETGREALYPDYLLFNGGTLAPPIIRERIQTQVGDWFEPQAGVEWVPTELENPVPELAVAMGAAYYGLVRVGRGVRVGSGSPRAFYIGVGSIEGNAEENLVDQGVGREQTENGAIPELIRAVCLVPRGTEEGSEVRLSELAFEALTNQPVSFQLYTSSTRLGDKLGDTVSLTEDEITLLPPIQTVLRYGRRGSVDRLPVQLGVRLTEVGTLELWCYAQRSEHRWQLQFDIRQGEEPTSDKAVVAETVDQAMIEAAQELIRQTFVKDGNTNHKPQDLRKQLEEMFKLSKESWPVPLIRQLADALLEVMNERAISAEHEARWLNLLGFCLRPGFGDPVDEWRMKRVWTLYFQGLQFPKSTQNRTEWWIFWRRVAGGMKAGQQADFFSHIRSYILAGGSKRRKKSKSPYPKHLGDAELSEIWLALANFEWLPVNIKVELGRTLLKKGKRGYKLQELWALSRFGARTPAYGPIDRLIPGTEASAWLETILNLPLQQADGVAQVLVMLARHTGDRVRDVPEENRDRVAKWLEQHPRSDRFQSLLMDAEANLDKEEQERLFGESLPEGLVLVSP
ncbi:MAG: Hsp70 family protein [Chloroflexota bacterium]